MALFLALALAAIFTAGKAHSAVILSELCDPQNNYTTDRFIEIYNTGSEPVDLANWRLIAIGNSVNVTTWTLSGTLAAGQAKVAGGPTTVTGFTVDFQSAVWATTAGYMNWNGKVGDGAKLIDADSVTVDSLIAPDVLFENADLVRNADIANPSLGYIVSEWTATPVTLATDASPGTHNGSPPPPAGPRISNIATLPASPSAGVPVDVQAAVVDTAGPLNAVTLAWGTTSSSLPNVIGMPLLSDSTFRTSEPIPAQAAGIIIYYRVQAEGILSSSASSVRNYVIPGGGVGIPPTILAVGEMSDSTLLVFFSEPVDEASAETPTNYTVGALTGVAAVRDSAQTSQVLVTIRNIAPGTRTLSVSGVADLEANVASSVTRNFNYVDVTIPAGYYNSALGLYGPALRVALHNIIKNHTMRSYDYVLTAFQTTDVKPNGKVWDPYSDVPGGTPPYEYTFGQTGQGATEGLGYNREHSWPQSWFDEGSPMRSDLGHLFPTDSKVNGYRGSFPFGEVDNPTTTSLNGSKVGPNVSPGYSGTVFEPVDAYKGDLARGQFYMATRYFNEDSGWPGSPSSDGADILPWAADLYMQWTLDDPVSWKDRMRNGAIYVIQNNRNPFVDHPEFVRMIYDSNAVVSVSEMPASGLRLRQNYPNPFGARTTITFDLARRERVALRVYDVGGRLTRTLVGGSFESGSHRVEWNGRDDGGALVDAGLYFCQLEAGRTRETKRLVFIR